VGLKFDLMLNSQWISVVGVDVISLCPTVPKNDAAGADLGKSLGMDLLLF